MKCTTSCNCPVIVLNRRKTSINQVLTMSPDLTLHYPTSGQSIACWLEKNKH